MSLAFALRFRALDRTLTDDEVSALRQTCIDAVVAGARRRAPQLSERLVVFTHRIRVRYAEIDGQGVVFNAHWLTYFDDTCTRFMESLGFGPEFWTVEFDVMLVRAALEWKGSARFDEWIDIAVAPVRLGTKSFDLHYTATVGGRAACDGDDHLRRGAARREHLDRDPGEGSRRARSARRTSADPQLPLRRRVRVIAL